MGEVGRLRLYHEEFWWLWKLLDDFAVFYFKTSLKTSKVAGFWDTLQIEWNRFYQVISYVHHQLHITGYMAKHANFGFERNTQNYSFLEVSLRFNGSQKPVLP
jgi:hypothetical protein